MASLDRIMGTWASRDLGAEVMAAFLEYRPIESRHIRQLKTRTRDGLSVCQACAFQVAAGSASLNRLLAMTTTRR